MVPYEQVTHRPSILKQQNKKHNLLGHRTKGQIAAQNKGRVNEICITKAQKTALSRDQRRHQAKQKRTHRRKEVISKKRFLGTESAPPFLVTVICLHDDASSEELFKDLESIAEATVTKSSAGLLHVSYGRLKQRFSFITPPEKDLYAILDATKVSDTVLFIWKYGESLNSEKEHILSCIQVQGMPSAVHVVTGDQELSHKKKVRAERELRTTVSSHFPENTKLYSLKKFQDVLLFFRQIGCQKRKTISFRDRRMHMIAENIHFTGEGTVGTLEVDGYIRGKPITANDLIHVPGYGEFQISEIHLLRDPYPLELNGNSRMETNVVSLLVSVPDPVLQESLATTRDVIEDDEMKEFEDDDDDDGASSHLYEELEAPLEGKTSKRIPKGMSDYQSAWILSDDEGDGDDEDEDDGHHSDALSGSLAPKSVGDEESLFNVTEDNDNETAASMTDAGDEYDKGFDFDEEMEDFRKLKAAKEDMAFPDEVDTPMDLSARERFRKYRGLESFRTSPWVQNESLPDDYAKIFQFKDFRHIKKTVLKGEKQGIQPGSYVKICLKDVPLYMYTETVHNNIPLTLFSLLKHEQKMTVLNIVLKSHLPGHLKAIQSKEKLTFHIGIRRFSNSPIFSEHTNGDKHKFFRFFHPGQTVVATMYAPIAYPPCPVSVYQRRLDGTHALVATGSVYSVNPNRIICKRVILSGHPIKVNKKSAVIRYMFFNAADISWFKPIELRTKWGRKGHIVEPLGTHGHMKCKFNGQLKSQDSVLMKLYKRVFPKWHYDPYVEKPFLAGQQPVARSLTSSSLMKFFQDPEPSSKAKRVRFEKKEK